MIKCACFIVHKKALSNFYFFSLITAFGLAVFLLNYYFPLLPGDDFLYSLKFEVDSFIGSQPISSIEDFFSSQKHHFNNYNYRIFPHFFLQLLLLLPPIFFDILNTGVFFIIPFLLLRPAVHLYKSQYKHAYLLLFLLTFGFHIDLGWSYLWTTGAMNYYWPLIFQVYLLGSFYLKQKTGRPFSKMECLSAIPVALSNEHILFSFFLATIYLMLIEKRAAKKTDKRLLTVSVILLLGGLVMMVSPSFMSRLSSDSVLIKGQMSTMVERVIRLIYYLTLSLVPLFIFVIALGSKSLLRFNGLTVILAFSLSLAILLVTIPEPRMAGFFLFIFLMHSTAELKKDSQLRSYYIAVLLLICLIRFSYHFFNLKVLNENAKIMYAKLSKVDDNAVLKVGRLCLFPRGNYTVCDDIQNTPEHFHNKTVSSYFGLESVVAKNRFNIDSSPLSDKGQPIKKHINQMSQRPISYSFNKEATLESIYFDKNKDSTVLSLVFDISNIDFQSDDYSIIIRGAKDTAYVRFLDLIPSPLRLYFLSFLEDHAVYVDYGNNLYVYSDIWYPEVYRYFVVSLYSKTEHKAVGQPLIITNDF